MTELLKEYLDFCKENHESLEYASNHAEEDCFFDFYYNGAIDSVHVHYNNGMEVEMNYDDVEAMVSYASLSNGMEVEMNYDDVEEFESAENDLAQAVKEVVDTLKEEY